MPAHPEDDQRQDATDETTAPEPGSRPEPGPASGPATDDDRPAYLILPPGARVPGGDAEAAGDPAGSAEPDAENPAGSDDDTPATGLIEEPAKVMRIGSMIKRLLDEVRESPLDEAARTRLASIHERSLHELEDGLSPDLVDELHRITLPFTDAQTPTDAELRIAQAQLVGWLEGLFHGIQTALVAQQIAAQQQLSQMRRGLPPGLFGQSHQAGAGPQAPGEHGDDHDGRPTPGQYL